MASDAAAPKKTELAITGMTCAACASRIERVVGKVAGVREVNVDLIGHRAVVVHDGVPAATLMSAVARAGYGATIAEPMQLHVDAEYRDYVRRLVVALAFGVPVVVMAMSHGLVHIPYQRWLELGLSLPVMGYAGWPIWRGAMVAARHGGANMNTLVTLGAGASFALSLWALLTTPAAHHMHAHFYFEAAVAPVAFVLLSRVIETRLRMQANQQLRGISSQLADEVTVLVGGEPRTVARATLAVGDVVVVRPGEALAVDGTIASGASYIDEAMLTGESVPQRREVGSAVYAGTMNGSGALTVVATSSASESRLARIIGGAADAQASKAPISRLADAVSARMVPAILLLAAVTIAVWWLRGGPGAATRAFEFGAAVLMIACPCALGLATPAALSAALARVASLGVVVKSAAAFEKAARVQTVVFDKTGTLTEGRPDVVGLDPAPGVNEAHLLAMCAAAEAQSEHPLAGAVLRAAGARGVAVPAAEATQAATGQGVTARVDGGVVRVGKRAWLTAEGVAIGEVTERAAVTTIYVALDDAFLGTLAIADEVRADAAAAIAQLTHAGFSPVLLTGDNASIAGAVGGALGINDVIAEATPQSKADLVRQRAAQSGHGVAMVGDGMNDAVALASADVSIAMWHASDVSVAAADIVLTQNRLLDIAVVLGLAKRTLRVIKENLWWAFGYNVVALPLAAGVFYPRWGIAVSPMVASALMALSSISVLINSQRLRARGPRSE
ncbi:MAG: cadmium-translocating P-type ATPase [Myxococcales bacterium]|nr:cadmium-translocating P-type ATPase [Myxococcales bacterium]